MSTQIFGIIEVGNLYHQQIFLAIEHDYGQNGKYACFEASLTLKMGWHDLEIQLDAYPTS